VASILERLAVRRPLLSDSATGTWFQQRLGPATVGGECCDQYNVTAPELVRELYRAKVAAGADMVLTNTFGSTPLRLAEFHVDPEAADGFNKAGVRLLQDVRRETDREIFIGGNVGPTGKIIGQSASYDEVMDSMVRQIRTLVRAGVDLICIETMLQSLEGQVAVEAAREVFAAERISIPLCATFAFMNRPNGSAGEFRTFFGDTVRHIIVGANCSIGVEDAVSVADEFTRYCSEHALLDTVFVSVKPNSQVMATMTYEDPEFVAARFGRLVAAGADLIGFCCGSVPAHIAAVARQRQALRGF